MLGVKFAIKCCNDCRTSCSVFCQDSACFCCRPISFFEGSEMNGIHQNVDNHIFEKSFPGCLRRMVNLFELNVGVSSNRMLTDKPHPEGSPLSRSRSDVTRMSPSGDPMEEKEIVSEIRTSRSTRKSNGTPMKILIAQEMSKDVDSRCGPPNVIAKLMGLDTLPRQEADVSMQRNHSRGHSRSHSDTPTFYWEQQNGFFCDIEPHEYKDVYETLEKSPHKGRYGETSNDKRMALVLQKFVEAKRMSMDEKLRQSKQFQDALEVLNSNKDLFLECLQEPMFSHNLYTLPSIPPPEIKRITVLRPSKVANSNDFSGAGNSDGKQIKKGAFVLLNGLEKSQLFNSSPAWWKNYESPSQATRIVVLKPSPVKSYDIKADIYPRVESPTVMNGEDILGDVEDDENQESREVAKAITQQMREKLGRHHRDEDLMSSVFSNGYVGDESSFNKSEIEYAAGNLSDSEVMSPLSRHSWDYVNRLGSPFSTSSFGRVSCSPESSVCREAKKRLSERWAMMASNGSCQEQTYARRISTTLGEMLALSETKKAVMPGEVGISNKERKGSNYLADNGPELSPNESMNHSPKNLIRSKSVPVSFTEYGTRLSTSISVPDKDEAEARKDETKERIVKSSFKGKVSSLCFLRNKKASKDKSLSSDTKDEFHHKIVPEQGCNRSEGLTDEGFQHFSPTWPKLSNKASSSNQGGEFAATCPETGFSMEKPVASGNSGENLDQPSPISVLDTPFEEDEHVASVFPHYLKPDRRGDGLPANPVRSNLINKSPPIGSIARTLPWDDSCIDTVSRYSPNQSFSCQGTDEEKREWFFFVKTLLSVSDLLGEVQSNSYLARWHSPDSPLDPLLRDKYIDLKDKETVHEKQRLKRSTRKLVFDCVNTALVEIVGYGSVAGQRAIPCIKTLDSVLGNTSFTILDEVWNRTNLWLSGEIKCVLHDCGNDNSLMLERVVRREVVGKGWIDHLTLEADNLGKEIEGKLLEELVEEAVVEFTGRVQGQTIL